MHELPALSTNKIAQVAIAVNDVEEAAARFAALLGVPLPNIIDTDPGHKRNQVYRGQPNNNRARLAFLDMGGVQLELIQPVGDESVWAEGLRDSGEAVHHIAFWTENMREDKKVLEAHGVEMIQRGDMGDGQYAYFDGRPKFGVMIELLEKVRTVLE